MKRWVWSGCLLAVVAGTAVANDTWLVADLPVLRSGQTLELHATTGASFPAFGLAPDPAGVARAGWRIGSQRGEIASFARAESTIVARGRPLAEGVAVAWLDFRPQAVELSAKEVAHYFDDIGASESLRQAWASAGPGATFHETRTVHAKTFVRVGDAPADRTCLEAVGPAVEFLPDRDPTALAAGATLGIKVMKKGNELEGFAVGVVCGADGSTTQQRTNQAGYVQIVIRHGGWWLIRGTELRRNADGTWDSDVSTMTFYAGGNR